MATEIELKAHVRDVDTVKQLLAEKAAFLCSFEKDDTLWFPANTSAGKDTVSSDPSLFALPATGLRVRREKRIFPDGKEENSVIITYKNKEIRDGIEINDEKEFQILSQTGNGAEVFEDFLTRVHLGPGSGKRKKGWAYSVHGITAELHEVEGLGWFLELEILADNGREETVSNGRKRLLEILASLGIGGEAIENRPYMQMLASRGN